MELQKNRSYLQKGWVFTPISRIQLILSCLIFLFLILLLFLGLYKSYDRISSISMEKEVSMQVTKDTKHATSLFSEGLESMETDISALDLKDLDFFQTEISGVAMKHSVIISNLNVLPEEYAGEGKNLMPRSYISTLIVEGYLRDVREFFVDLQILYPTSSTKTFKIDVVRNKIKVDTTLFLSDYKDN